MMSANLQRFALSPVHWGWLLLVMLPQGTGCGTAVIENVGSEVRSSDSASLPLTPAKFPLARRDWPAFRGPTGMGVAAEADVPVSWGGDRNIAWKMELPGPGASSPIVFGDRVYVTCYTGYLVPGDSAGSLEKLQRHLLAIRLEDGEILWNRAVGAKLPEEPRIRDHGYAANTPAADDDRVYVFFGKTGVLAYDHDGNLQWQTDVGSRTSDWGTSASPVVHEEGPE